ncbi:MAG: Flp family type IVb pilin [Desulfuromonadales bacterium]|nr:Flp family type IVb pilin [Desulfuromonadales bacterium]
MTDFVAMKLRRALVRLARDEQGATATEYAIMIVLILLVAFATIIFLGLRVDEAFQKFVDLMEEATN